MCGSPRFQSFFSIPAMSHQERNESIKHLKMALETSRRRAAALEQSLAAGGYQQPRNAAAGGRGAGSRAGRANTDALKDMLAQSALHFKQYQQIRSNYNSLLGRCEGTSCLPSCA